jgi:hypothetical protein
MSTRWQILYAEKQIKFDIRGKLVTSCFMLIKKSWKYRLMWANNFIGLCCIFSIGVVAASSSWLSEYRVSDVLYDPMSVLTLHSVKF